MRYAIVSDLHSNLPAWNAVLADIAALKVRRIICLGDVVGYGPQPAEVLESAYRHIDYFVMGNHDAVVAGSMSDDVFNEHAREMIRWTQRRLSSKARAFLASRPLVLDGAGFVCCHGSLDHPQAFNYVESPQEALDTWSATGEPMVFIGHTHVPAIFVLGESGTPHVLPPRDFMMEGGKRYIVNVGSVGDPRDSDPRASYCIFDDATRVVSFRRVAFDYDTLRSATSDAGLDTSAVLLLGKDPLSSRATVREALDFSPPTDENSMAMAEVSSAAIGSLRRSNAWLRLGISASLVALSAAIGVASAFWRHDAATRSASFPPDPLPRRIAYSWMDTEGNLVRDFRPPGPKAPKESVHGWRYVLESPGDQSVSLSLDPDTARHILVVSNTGRHSFMLEAQEWELGGHASGRVQAMIKALREEDFRGKATLSVIANRGLPDETILISVPLAMKKQHEWTLRKRMTDKYDNALRIGSGTQSLTFRIEADFSGTLCLAEPALLIKRE
ncbi:MAG: metallophosphoesterase family protein [Kiritimatiellae bacterium]|nr:metallophosphoesterase family protein [Kiritimatiellia bacterium]